ncbi:MAG TPA: PIN domain-containing protein [Rectinemataceae bacterium]|nr:PIN domain-containing protein [Rectinemataceae bacterium]
MEFAKLPPGSIVLVDTAAFVYLLEGSGARRRVVEASFASARERGLDLIASTIVWTELLDGAGPRAELAAGYRSLLADSARIRLIGVDVAVAEEAAGLLAAARAAGRPLGLADSLHIATAIVMGAKAVLGNDEAWRQVPPCPPLLLIDELAFDLEA